MFSFETLKINKGLSVMSGEYESFVQKTEVLLYLVIVFFKNIFCIEFYSMVKRVSCPQIRLCVENLLNDLPRENTI